MDYRFHNPADNNKVIRYFRLINSIFWISTLFALLMIFIYFINPEFSVNTTVTSQLFYQDPHWGSTNLEHSFIINADNITPSTTEGSLEGGVESITESSYQIDNAEFLIDANPSISLERQNITLTSEHKLWDVYLLTYPEAPSQLPSMWVFIPVDNTVESPQLILYQDNLEISFNQEVAISYGYQPDFKNTISVQAHTAIHNPIQEIIYSKNNILRSCTLFSQNPINFKNTPNQTDSITLESDNPFYIYHQLLNETIMSQDNQLTLSQSFLGQLQQVDWSFLTNETPEFTPLVTLENVTLENSSNRTLISAIDNQDSTIHFNQFNSSLPLDNNLIFPEKDLFFRNYTDDSNPFEIYASTTPSFSQDNGQLISSTDIILQYSDYLDETKTTLIPKGTDLIPWLPQKVQINEANTTSTYYIFGEYSTHSQNGSSLWAAETPIFFDAQNGTWQSNIVIPTPKATITAPESNPFILRQTDDTTQIDLHSTTLEITDPTSDWVPEWYKFDLTISERTHSVSLPIWASEIPQYTIEDNTIIFDQTIYLDNNGTLTEIHSIPLQDLSSYFHLAYLDDISPEDYSSLQNPPQISIDFTTTDGDWIAAYWSQWQEIFSVSGILPFNTEGQLSLGNSIDLQAPIYNIQGSALEYNITTPEPLQDPDSFIIHWDMNFTDLEQLNRDEHILQIMSGPEEIHLIIIQENYTPHLALSRNGQVIASVPIENIELLSGSHELNLNISPNQILFSFKDQLNNEIYTIESPTETNTTQDWNITFGKVDEIDFPSFQMNHVQVEYSTSEEETTILLNEQFQNQSNQIMIPNTNNIQTIQLFSGDFGFDGDWHSDITDTDGNILFSIDYNSLYGQASIVQNDQELASFVIFSGPLSLIISPSGDLRVYDDNFWVASTTLEQWQAQDLILSLDPNQIGYAHHFEGELFEFEHDFTIPWNAIDSHTNSWSKYGNCQGNIFGTFEGYNDIFEGTHIDPEELTFGTTEDGIQYLEINQPLKLELWPTSDGTSIINSNAGSLEMTLNLNGGIPEDELLFNFGLFRIKGSNTPNQLIFSIGDSFSEVTQAFNFPDTGWQNLRVDWIEGHIFISVNGQLLAGTDFIDPQSELLTPSVQAQLTIGGGDFVQESSRIWIDKYSIGPFRSQWWDIQSSPQNQSFSSIDQITFSNISQGETSSDITLNESSTIETSNIQWHISPQDNALTWDHSPIQWTNIPQNIAWTSDNLPSLPGSNIIVVQSSIITTPDNANYLLSASDELNNTNIIFGNNQISIPNLTYSDAWDLYATQTNYEDKTWTWSPTSNMPEDIQLNSKTLQIESIEIQGDITSQPESNMIRIEPNNESLFIGIKVDETINLHEDTLIEIEDSTPENSLESFRMILLICWFAVLTFTVLISIMHTCYGLYKDRTFVRTNNPTRISLHLLIPLIILAIASIVTTGFFIAQGTDISLMVPTFSIVILLISIVFILTILITLFKKKRAVHYSTFMGQHSINSPAADNDENDFSRCIETYFNDTPDDISSQDDLFILQPVPRRGKKAILMCA